MDSVLGQAIPQTFYHRVSKTPDKVAFKRKINGHWEEITFKEYYEFVEELCLALIDHGIQKGDTCAILSNSRAEWAFCDFAILNAGGITIPIYQSSTAEEIEYILNDAKVKVLFVEDDAQLKKVKSIQANVPTLQKIITFSDHDDTNTALPLNEFCQKGLSLKAKNPKLFEELLHKGKPEDIATIVYTSGTTGVPKGVVLTHENFICCLKDVKEAFSLDERDTILGFLPFAHIFARIELHLGMALGWTHAFAENIDKLVNNLSEIRPTFMFSVPRIYEKVYNKIISQVSLGSPLKKKIFYWSVNVGQEVSRRLQQDAPMNPILNLKYKLATKLVFSKLQAKFGGRIRFFISGGAPLSKEIAEFFHAAGFLILEGYGLTETTAASFINRENNYEFGTVGLPLGDIQVKIADDGEILLKSKKVFKEYYNNPEATSEVLKEGWFYTGDVGYITQKGMLKITDRKKDLIVTSGGKNIAPQKIENLLKNSIYISQAMVYGDKQKYLSALITLNIEEIENHIASRNLSLSNGNIHKAPEVYEMIQNEIRNVNEKLPSFETIKKFYILKEDFTIERGELTPSMKIKRKYCTEKFKTELESMYD